METLSLKRAPKHEELKKILKKIIFSSEYKPGSLLPSQNELSKRFDVGHNTVREAVSALVHEGIVYRVQGSGTFISKTADLSFKGSIGVAFPGASDDLTSHPAYYRLLLILEKNLKEQGYEVLFTTCQLNNDKEESYGLKFLKRNNLAGVIIFGAIGTEEIYQKIVDEGICLLVYNNCLQNKRIKSVDVDRFRAASQCTSFLRSKDYANLYAVTRRAWRNLPSVSSLYQGFMAEGSKGTSNKLPEEFLLSKDVLSELRSFFQKESKNIQKTLTGLFLTSDLLLPQLTEALIGIDSKMLTNLGVTVFHETEYPLPSYVRASIEYDKELVGGVIAEEITALVEGKDRGREMNILLPTKLVSNWNEEQNYQNNF